MHLDGDEGHLTLVETEGRQTCLGALTLRALLHPAYCLLRFYPPPCAMAEERLEWRAGREDGHGR